MQSINVLVNGKLYASADLEDGSSVPDGLVEMGKSLLSLRNGEDRELRLNDSKLIKNSNGTVTELVLLADK